MISEIITAISKRLGAMYADCTVAIDHVEQGLREPCFFIDLLEPSRTPLLGQRWRQENLFDVQLFDSEAGNVRLYAVAEELFGGLEYITLPDGGLLRGTQMRFTVEDGVLHFFVTYAVILYHRENKECMEILELEEEVKEASNG